MLFCSVLQRVSSFHGATDSNAPIGDPLYLRNSGEVQVTAVSGVQHIPCLLPLPTVEFYSVIFLVTIMEIINTQDQLLPLLSFSLLLSLHVSHSWYLITDCKKNITPSSC